MTKRKPPTTKDDNDDPFVSFTEWAGEADEKAYAVFDRKSADK